MHGKGLGAVSELSEMQKRYIWLMGSYADRIMVQGRGKRSRRLLYAFHGDDELVLFGYSNPPMWLVTRGLIRALQAPRTYTLTDLGEAAFNKLLISGAGMKINREIKEVEVAA
jgi:hypothetical protein